MTDKYQKELESKFHLEKNIEDLMEKIFEEHQVNLLHMAYFFNVFGMFADRALQIAKEKNSGLAKKMAKAAIKSMKERFLNVK